METVNFILLPRPANYWTPWEEMSAQEQALAMYSDIHKEAFGFRPREAQEMTAGQAERAIKYCARVIKADREREAQARIQRKFTKRQAEIAKERIRKKACNREEWKLGDFWNAATA